MALICDTGVLYGALDATDQDHGPCAQLLEVTSERLVVPAPVLVEVEWLASSRIDSRAFDAILCDVEDGILKVEDLQVEDYSRIRRLCAQYDDLPLGFVDAAVIALAERFAEPKVATLDRRHFSVIRPRHVPALTLLPT